MTSRSGIASADESQSASSQGATLENGAIRVAQQSRPYLTVEAVDSQSSMAVVQAPGRIAFRDKAVSSVGSPAAGRILQIHVQAGDHVKSGQPLLTLNSPGAATARAELARARVELQSAQDQLKRQVDMLQRGVGLEVENFAAEIHLREAQTELERTSKIAAAFGNSSGETLVLSAPISGTILRLTASVGAAVESGGPPLVEIGDPTALWIVADVFEHDLSCVREGAEATVALASVPTPVHGQVVAVGAMVEPGLRRAPVYIALADQQLSLHAGMYTRVAIHTPASQGVIVPVTAVLIKDSTRTIVYVESSEDVFVPRDVIINQSIGGSVQVLSGLSPGERVVTKGALLLDQTAEQLL